jgi:hypothetical protein
MSSANYAAGGGSSEDLPNGGQIANVTVDGMYLYDWKPDWRIYGGANFSYIETDDGTFTRSNSGISDVLVGAQNWYDMGPLDVAIQGDFFYPVYQPDENGDEAVLGEGAMRLRGGGWMIYPMGALKPFGYLGFEYRNGGRSYLLPYSVGAKYRIGKMWVQGEYRGYETIVDDADTENRADRDLFLRQVNGGSYRYYSINPALSELAVEVGMRFGALKVFGGLNMTVNGSSSAAGWGGMVGLSYSPSDAGSGSRDDFDIRDESYDESLFNNEKESSDTEKFQEPQFREDPNFVEPPVTAPPPEQLEQRRVHKAAPKPAKPLKSPKQQAIEDAQDVEMQIELQHVKPKKKKKKKKNVDKLLKETEKMLEGG